ncbi:MAG: hypothetical protein ACLFPE_03410, partial [Bacteroidales bacterium]
MNTAFIVLSVITITLTVVALIDKKAWWIRIFDFPRLQIISLQMVAIGGLLLIELPVSWDNGIMAALMLLALVVQVSYIFPYFPFTRKEVPDQKASTDKVISLL